MPTDHTSLPPDPATIGAACPVDYPRGNQIVIKQNINLSNDITSFDAETHVASEISKRQFPSPLIPLARRSGLEAVARAYDAGMTTPAVRS